MQFIDDTYQRFHWDAADKKIIIESGQDVGPYLRMNKEASKDASLNKYSKTPDKLMGRHVAQIPMIIYRTWQREWQTYTGSKYPPTAADKSWAKFMKQKLQDRDNRFLRVDGRKD